MVIVGNFLKYSAVGVLNTAVHWIIFLALVGLAGAGQGPANLAAFLCAVTMSFFLNARLTFRAAPSLRKFLAYALFLGLVAFATGWGAERAGLPPLLTLVLFSGISLALGFLYSQFLVFAERAK